MTNAGVIRLIIILYLPPHRFYVLTHVYVIHIPVPRLFLAEDSF